MNLSEKQMSRIAYEAMLLKMSVQNLMIVAPFLFNENITAANTEATEPIKIQPEKDINEPIYDMGSEAYLSDEDYPWWHQDSPD